MEGQFLRIALEGRSKARRADLTRSVTCLTTRQSSREPTRLPPHLAGPLHLYPVREEGLHGMHARECYRQKSLVHPGGGVGRGKTSDGLLQTLVDPFSLTVGLGVVAG